MSLINFRNAGRPKEPVQEKRHPDQDIYFIGDFMYPIDDNGKPVVKDIQLSADGHGTFTMPEIGGKLRVPANVANILIRNGRMPYPKGHPMWRKGMRDALTVDPEYARIKALAFKSGQTVEAVSAQENLSQVSDEAFLAEMQRRGMVYQDGKVQRKDPDPSGEIKTVDDLPESNTEEVKYQDEVDSDGQPKKGPGRPKSKKDGE